MDLNASIFKPGETIRVEAHDGEGGRSTVRIGRVRLVGCGEPEPQEGDAMQTEGVENLAGHDGILDCCQDPHPRAAAHSQTSNAKTLAMSGAQV